MLLGNITQIAQNCIRYSAYNGTTERSMLGTNSSNHLLRFSYLSKQSAIPNGYKTGSCWFPSITEGGMSMVALGSGVMNIYPAYLPMTGSGSLAMSGIEFSVPWTLTGSGDLAISGVEFATICALTGSGSLSISGVLFSIICALTGSSTWNTDMSLVQSMVCALSGSGDLTGTALQLILMVASLTGDCSLSIGITGQKSPTVSMTGSGDISANISGFGEMVAALLGSGTLSATSKGIADMSVDVVVTGTGLNTANVGHAVWDAMASDFDKLNTMGGLVNNVGAGANPWDAIIEGSVTAEEALKTILSVLAGKTTIVKGSGTTATVKFRDVNDTRDSVTATMNGSQRTNVILNND